MVTVQYKSGWSIALVIQNSSNNNNNACCCCCRSGKCTVTSGILCMRSGDWGSSKITLGFLLVVAVVMRRTNKKSCSHIDPCWACVPLPVHTVWTYWPYDLDLLTSGSMHAESCHALSGGNFAVDSSRCFPFTTWTDTDRDPQTHTVTNEMLPTLRLHHWHG